MAMTIEQQRALALAAARRRAAEAQGGQPAPSAEPAAPAAPPQDDGFNKGWDYWDNTGANLFAGARRGVTSLLGIPVGLINNAPRLANLIPGVDGVEAFSENPVGGSQSIDDALRLNGLIPDAPEPQDALQRVAGRVGYEVGAAALPVGAAAATAARVGHAGLRSLSPVVRPFVEPAVANGGGFLARETGAALAAGAGAGLANEAVGNEQFGDNFWSDFIGSLAGVGAYGAGSAVAGGARNVYAGATGNPRYMDNVAGQEVADRMINSSSTMQEQFARTGQLDTQQVVDALRRPAPIEEAVPGYRANIGDRTQDPGLATFAYNQDATSPGAANARRSANESAINERMDGLAPGGDPARFRAELDTARTSRINEATGTVDARQQQLDAILQALNPTMSEATARGSSIRSGLADAYSTARDRVDELYAPINQSQTRVDISPLRDQFGEIDAALPLNDRQRFRPTEANVPGQLAPTQPEAPLEPVNTGLIDDRGRPILRPAAAPEPEDTRVPVSEVTAMRSGLTDDIRAQRASGQNQAARVGGQYQEAIDDFTAEALPPELQGRLDLARAERRDVGERFERRGTGIAETLRTREGGGYALDDSAVPPRFAQPDSGRLSDLRALLAEAGTDPRVRAGLADEVLADVQSRGLVNRPEQLGRYMAERNVLLGEFPELRANLEQAGVSRRALTQAEEAQTSLTRDLTTPGRSATASYLRYGDEAVGDAIRTVTASAQPRDAVRELLSTANTPTARQDLRSALWTEVRRRGQEQAPGITGEQRWNGKRLRDMFNDPKVSAVADELWADNPEDLADIKEVFSALANAEGSVRARAANTSGTAQSLSGRYDPSLTTTSLAARARSVQRGFMSPSIAIIDAASMWLRGKSAQVQARAIDQLASSVVNNPGMAADLLERYNPAMSGAFKRMITQKYGVRGTQLLNLLDEMEDSETDDGRMRELIVEGVGTGAP